MPPELAKLDCLSKQLIGEEEHSSLTCFKGIIHGCFGSVCTQADYRLIAFGMLDHPAFAKAPVYNSLKACKGTMFFLLLPFNKTLGTIGQVKHLSSALPEAELYIILNGKPTKQQIVWRSLVNVDLIKTAVQKLTETNWLYKGLDDNSVDEAAKRVIEVTNNTSSTMLEKASTDDIAFFQAYTIRSLDNKLSSESDIEQYKFLSVKEDVLDNRENYLDVVLFRFSFLPDSLVNAPVIGQDEPDKILAWVQVRITCRIPDVKSDPDLHMLVTRYQTHKCSAYCKQRRRCGDIFITRCRFGCPHQACQNAALHCVEEALKSRKRIYELPRSDVEVRVNDYNPLLLMLWKANIYIQYVAESSLALAHYVSGYVTKAEKSHLQDIWQEVSDTKGVYSRLWSIGISSLRSQECGLYEASDLLLGDHLTEKSETVKWVDVSMPDKRSRRLKDHKVLEDVAKHNPDSEDIFQSNLLDTYYLQRPNDLEDVCLYFFIANYDYCGTDSRTGERQYHKLTKPRLPNHILFDPEKEEQRQGYYYSLILLFVPFRDESSLLLENETAEEAFQCLLPAESDGSAYHPRLQKILQAQAVKKINDARQADGEENTISKEDDEPQLMGEARAAMKDLFDMNTNPANTLSLEQRVVMLNTDQRRVFDKVKAHFLHQKEHKANKCACDLTPL